MKILLVCYGGLSTSMLVNRMKTAVAESKNLRDKNIVIEAWGKEEYYEKLDDTRIIMPVSYTHLDRISRRGYCISLSPGGQWKNGNR